MIRIGHGFDVHAFGGDKPLVLGGVTIADHQGLQAHSDGDVILHAVCDALLGGLALGDIGKHFPDNDDAYAGAASRGLLRHVFQLVNQQGYWLTNLDVTVIAQTPRMAGHIDAIRENIAQDLQADITQINVKATTTEKLGYIGRNEGISVHAVCIVHKK